MHNNKNIIGILGGTFDPIHYGHLRMGQEILDKHQLNRVHFVPCHRPVHRGEPHLNAHHRLEMVSLAIQSQPRFIADSREINRQTPSYTYDTLISFKEEMPDVTLCLLIGVDAFLHYASWHKPHDILELAHIIIAHRPNYELPTSGQMMDFLQQYQTRDMNLIQRKSSGSIYFQSITPLDISAKKIREHIALHESARYLLPDSVYNYIKNNQLYLNK